MEPTYRRMQKWLKLPPVKWNTMATFEKHPNALVAYMNGDAIRLIQMAEYIWTLRNGGTHDSAVKAANKKRRAVRKALGYSYPDAGGIKF